MDEIAQQMVHIVRLENISHHELMKFIYVYNALTPIRRVNEVAVYYYDGVAYFAAIIGKVVTLIKVKYD